MMIHECVSHDLTLSNLTMQLFQSIQESWHYYIDIIYFFETFERRLKLISLIGLFSIKI